MKKLIDRALAFAVTSGLPIIIAAGGTRKSKDTHRVYLKGKSGSMRWKATWHKVDIRDQDREFMRKTHIFRILLGNYQFFKEKDFRGESITLGPGETFPPGFSRLDVRSWRGV